MTGVDDPGVDGPGPVASPGTAGGLPGQRPPPTGSEPGAGAPVGPPRGGGVPAGSVPAGSVAPAAGSVAPAAGSVAPVAGDLAWRPLADTGVPLAVYLASRAVQLVFVAWLGGGWRGLSDHLMRWDAGWFEHIAGAGYPHGYSYDAAGHMVGNGLAFFPAYPAVIAAVRLLGLPGTPAALATSAVAGAVAAVLVHRLGSVLGGRRTGYALVALVFTQPMSVVLSMGYSESLFLAVAAGALLAAHRRRWYLAGLLGLTAGLVRPTGLAVGVALAVAALLAYRRGQRGPRPWVAVALSVIGTPAYIAWVGLRVGDPYAWFRIQRAGWGTSFDFGSSAVRFVAATLRDGTGWIEVSTALLLIAAVVAAVWAAASRTWPPLLVYGLVVVVLAICQAGYYHSKPRLLVPALIVLLPAAMAAGRARRVGAAVLGLAAFGLFGLWYGAYMVTVWPYAI